MIEIWGRANAYNVQKTLWMLRELELEFRHHDLGSTAGDLETAEFLALNPHARIPVIRDGDAVVWESNTVLRYLGAKYDSGGLWPTDAYQRSFAERWMDWELATLQVDFIDLFWGFYRTPAEARDAQAIAAAARRCVHDFDLLDRQLRASPYLGGERFTIGDIPCAVCLYRYFEMGFDVPRPEYVMQWYARLAERPAFRATVMIPFDELRGRLEF
ncbi:MAG TPA: glutathione S-transferase family protein [Gammaproteobacteria bacterium]|nr:glutathione S-transferase family protein [Gammaproteobacteria bacterium]